MAWNFTGTEFLGVLTNTLDYNGSYSVSLWLRLDSLPSTYYAIFSLEQGGLDADVLRVDSAGVLILSTINNGSINDNTGSTLSTGVWYHIVVSRLDASTGNVYLDGNLDFGIAEIGQRTGTGEVFYFGAYAASTFALDGQIDSPRIYLTDLTEQQAKQERWTRTPQHGQPLHWWDPLLGSDDKLVNRGSAAEVLTEIGTVNLFAGPPISYSFDQDDAERFFVQPFNATIILTPAVAKFVVASPVLDPGMATIVLGATSAKFVVPSQTIVPGAVSLALTPSSAKFVVANPSLLAPAVLALAATSAKFVVPSQTLIPGGVSLALSPASAKFVVANPSLLAPAILALDPTLARFVVAPPSLVSGAVSLVLSPASAKFVIGLPALSNIVGDALKADPTVAFFVVASPSLVAATTVVLMPAEARFDVPEPSLRVGTDAVLMLEPVVLRLLMPNLGQQSIVVLVPTRMRFIVPPIRIIGIATLRDRIACTLMEEARAGEFYAVERNPNTRCTSTGVNVLAQSIEALTNEVHSDFNTARLHRRTFRDERINWLWRLYLGFAEEVTIERFEESLVAHPRVIPRDLVLGFPQVTLRLVETLYDHPVGEGSQGTKAILTIRAELAPV